MAVTALLDYDVDARSLVRWVRISRELRLVWRLALFGTLLWGAFVLGVERSTAEGSEQWRRADADASRGFVILLIVAGVAFVAQQSVRIIGPTGKAVALIVPAAGRPAPTTAVTGADHVTGLLAALRRTGYLGVGTLTAFLVITALLAGVSVYVWPAYEASHGRGGRVVTIGTDATFTSSQGSVSGRGGGTATVYQLQFDGGFADVAADTPHDGERWTVVHDPFGGNDAAYLVGGHAYVLDVVLGLVLLALDLGIGWYVVARIRSEWRRRRVALGQPSLADSLGALAAGARATLRIGTDRVGYRRRTLPALTVVLGAA